MIKRVKYNRSIKIGFFNQKESESEAYLKSLQKFKSDFDVLVMNDGNFTLINKIINQVKGL